VAACVYAVVFCFFISQALSGRLLPLQLKFERAKTILKSLVMGTSPVILLSLVQFLHPLTAKPPNIFKRKKKKNSKKKKKESLMIGGHSELVKAFAKKILRLSIREESRREQKSQKKVG
jgi:hypothetical protein